MAHSEVIPAGESSTQVVARSASPFDGNVTEFKGALARRGENRKSLIDWVRESLVDGVDYGKIHTRKKRECRDWPACTPEKNPEHWSKDSLRKSGAEKICGMLGITVTFPTMKDYEQAALAGTPISSIIMRCHLLGADGTVVADGIGARSVEQDYGDLNKALKMACKSGHIDATLRMAGLSEIFTQDLDDMKAAEEACERDRGNGGEHGHDERGDAPPPRRETPARQHQQSSPPQSNGNARRGFATDKQVALIERRMGDHGVEAKELCEAFSVPSVRDIPFNKVNDVLDWLAGGN